MSPDVPDPGVTFTLCPLHSPAWSLADGRTDGRSVRRDDDVMPTCLPLAAASAASTS